jgi:hypothetical protein
MAEATHPGLPRPSSASSWPSVVSTVLRGNLGGLLGGNFAGANMASEEQAEQSSNAAPQGAGGTPAEPQQQVPFTSRAAFPFIYDHSADIPPAHYAAARRNMAAISSGSVEPILPPQSANVPVSPNASAGTAPAEMKATPGEASWAGAGAMIADAEVQPAMSLSGKRNGIALVTNREPIIIKVEALLLFLDDKIGTLDRANSDEARGELEQYQHVKRELEKLREATVGLAVGEVSEDAAVEASNSFVQGIRNWWDERHIDICDKAFNTAIFLSCVSICQLCGAAGDLSVIVSGVITGGKTVSDALRAAAGLQKH